MATAKLNDIRLRYDSCGEGEPLLFIHGLGSSARDWENQVPFFADGFRVVTPDLRGHGRSDRPPGPYGIAQFANDIAKLIRILELGSTHVVGLSLGGFVASQLAIDHGELVRSLVIVNSAPALPSDTLNDRLRTKLELLLRRLIVRLFGMRTLGRFLCKKLFPRPEQADLRKTFVERWTDNDAGAYLDTLGAVSRWGVRDRLAAITCPTCVVSGENDFLPMSLKQEYLVHNPRAELVIIPDSGHFTPVDQKERFNDALRAFLERVSGTPSKAPV